MKITDEAKAAATAAMVQSLVQGGMDPVMAQDFTDEIMAATIAASEAAGAAPGVTLLSDETVKAILERVIAKDAKRTAKA